MKSQAPNALRPVLLAVDDERENLELVARSLSPDWDVVGETDPVRALAHVQPSTFAAVLTDFRMPRMDGTTFVRRLQAIDPSLVCVLVTAYGDLPEVRALKDKGAVCRLILKPWDVEHLRAAVESAAQFTRMRRAVSSLRPPPDR